MKDASEIKVLLHEYATSALTQRKFAARAGVAYSTFVYWLRKHRTGGFQEPAPEWIEAPAYPAQIGVESDAGLVLEWPGGLRLHVARGFGDEDVARLMQLAARSCSR